MDQTPASLFDAYEQDFLHLIQGIREKLDGDAKTQVGEQRKAALRRVEIELDEADDIVSQLEVEIQGIPNSVKSQYSSRLKQAKSELNKFKKLSKDLHAQAGRADLLAGGRRASPRSDDPYSDEPSQRDRLLVGQNRLQDGSRRLQESTSVAYQTEAYGAEILSTLRGQREQIENARDTMGTADANIDRSSNTIGKMIVQMRKQRFIIAGIIAFFVALIILILYFKLVR
ncbi:vesicle transport v-SNARE protein N-terminus-domain-containing protein [Coprinopsis sp. MPI-PUGE-AT-0042]|nr:vesicle transport v-SNARE protein N-terminus-domain-containing protein [Coprinopsis sp. MPI-PUGE-AT-0042]